MFAFRRSSKVPTGPFIHSKINSTASVVTAAPARICPHIHKRLISTSKPPNNTNNNSNYNKNNNSNDGFYTDMMDSYPLLTSAFTASILWGTGDVIAQRFIEKKESIESNRLQGTIVHGAITSGIGSYLWYSHLDAFVMNTLKLIPGSMRFVSCKLLLEAIIWHPITLLSYWCVVGYSEGHKNVQIIEELKKDFFITLLGDVSLWTPLDIINFKYVPLRLQVLFINIGSLMEAIILSYVHGNSSTPITHDEQLSSSVRQRHHYTIIEDLFAKMREDEIKSLAITQFKSMDRQKKGYLTLAELETCPLLPGVQDPAVKNRLLQLLHRKFNVDSDDKVYLDEYVRVLLKFHQIKYRETFIVDVIVAMYDSNNDGHIDINELDNVMKVYFMIDDISSESIKDIMIKYDLDKSGKLDVNEIKTLLKDYQPLREA